jgi:hypothetical protein
MLIIKVIVLLGFAPLMLYLVASTLPHWIFDYLAVGWLMWLTGAHINLVRAFDKAFEESKEDSTMLADEMNTLLGIKPK